MANIRLDLTIPVYDGQEVTFKAPCNSTDITGLIVYYPDGDSTVSKVFTLKDAHGNNLDTVDLFAEGVYLTAVLDTVNAFAYFKNADTNAYLEGRFNEYLPLTGGTLTGQQIYFGNGMGRVLFNSGAMQLESSNDANNQTVNQRILFMQNSTKNTLNNALRLVDVVDSKSTYYKIYGQHNIKAGTSDLTSGTSELATGDIYQKYV